MPLMKRPRGTPPEISQASTADIAFLLLIFFIATTEVGAEFGLQMILPGLGGKPARVKRENVMTITTDGGGGIYIDDRPVALREIRTTIQGELESNPNLIVSIETAADARYEQMIDVLDEVKLAKAPRFSIKKARR
ncbi:MAG: biopolymer transporter ExbD [Candidatus Eisenbacteria bacterium]|nr:biopolymer transporter ExbD [Candidatus Eisenbacteria bacterium]